MYMFSFVVFGVLRFANLLYLFPYFYIKTIKGMTCALKHNNKNKQPKPSTVLAMAYFMNILN